MTRRTKPAPAALIEKHAAQTERARQQANPVTCPRCGAPVLAWTWDDSTGVWFWERHADPYTFAAVQAASRVVAGREVWTLRRDRHSSAVWIGHPTPFHVTGEFVETHTCPVEAPSGPVGDELPLHPLHAPRGR